MYNYNLFKSSLGYGWDTNFYFSGQKLIWALTGNSWSIQQNWIILNIHADFSLLIGIKSRKFQYMK